MPAHGAGCRLQIDFTILTQFFQRHNSFFADSFRRCSSLMLLLPRWNSETQRWTVAYDCTSSLYTTVNRFYICGSWTFFSVKISVTRDSECCENLISNISSTKQTVDIQFLKNTCKNVSMTYQTTGWCKCASLRMWFLTTYYRKVFISAVFERRFMYSNYENECSFRPFNLT